MALSEKKQQLDSGRPERIHPLRGEKGISDFKRRQPTLPPKSTPPPNPKTLFEEKNEWSRVELGRKMAKASPYIPGAAGAMYSRPERKKIIDEIFPQQRFQSHISEMEAKRRLRELRKEEYQSRTGAEKLKISRLRRFLERETGLGGKY